MTTWNPSDADPSIVLSNNNLTAAGTVTSSWRSARATTAHTTGKYYFRVQANSYRTNGDLIVGVANSSASLLSYAGSDSHGIGSQCPNADAVYENGPPIGNTAGLTAINDYQVIAVDLTNNLYWSTAQHSGVLNTNWNAGAHSPAAGTGGFNIKTVANGNSVFPAFSAFDSGAIGTLDTVTSLSDSSLSGFLPWDNAQPPGLSETFADFTLSAVDQAANNLALSETFADFTLAATALVAAQNVTPIYSPCVAFQSGFSGVLLAEPLPPISYVMPQLPGLTWEIQKTPIFQTRVQRAVSGKEQRALDYPCPLWRWKLKWDFMRDNPAGGQNELRTLLGFFESLQGAFGQFAYNDPTDDHVVAQQIGIGNGISTQFQLCRTLGGFVETVNAPTGVSAIYLNGVALSSGWKVYDNGNVVFTNAPVAGAVITADFTYYWRVRFVDDGYAFENFLLKLWRQKQIELISDRRGSFTGTMTIISSPAAPPPIPTQIETSVAQGGGLGLNASLGHPLQTTAGLNTTQTNDAIVVWVVMQQSSAHWGPNVGPSPPALTSVSSTSGLQFARRFQWQLASFPLGTEQPASVAVEEWWAIAPNQLSGEVITANFVGSLLVGEIVAVAVKGPPPFPFDPNASFPSFNTNMTATQSSPGTLPISTTTPGATVLLFSAGWSSLNSGVLVCYNQLGSAFNPAGGGGFASIGQSFLGIAVTACAGYVSETNPITNQTFSTPGTTNYWVVLADALA